MKIENLFWGIFLLFGIFFAFTGTQIQKENKEFLKTAKSTTALITSIETHREADDDVNYIVYVEFEVEGQIYSGDLDGEYHAGMKTGKETTIYYDPVSPDNFKGPSTNFVGYVFVGFGTLAAVIGLVPIIRSYRKSKEV